MKFGTAKSIIMYLQAKNPPCKTLILNLKYVFIDFAARTYIDAKINSYCFMNLFIFAH